MHAHTHTRNVQPIFGVKWLPLRSWGGGAVWGTTFHKIHKVGFNRRTRRKGEGEVVFFLTPGTLELLVGWPQTPGPSTVALLKPLEPWQSGTFLLDRVF